MPFSGIVDPEQLSMLTEILDDHCIAHGIKDKMERDSVARRLVTFFQSGVQIADELRAVMSDLQRDIRRQG